MKVVKSKPASYVIDPPKSRLLITRSSPSHFWSQLYHLLERKRNVHPMRLQTSLTYVCWSLVLRSSEFGVHLENFTRKTWTWLIAGLREVQPKSGLIEQRTFWQNILARPWKQCPMKTPGLPQASAVSRFTSDIRPNFVESTLERHINLEST